MSSSDGWFPRTHGMSNTPEYYSWVDMRRRCYDPRKKGFHNYGGRGISVCERWQESFENFFADMGLRPTPKRHYSLERIDVNGNYEPGNCRWATWREQGRNRRTNVFIGEEILSEFARRVGKSAAAVSSKRKRQLRGPKKREYKKGADHPRANLSEEQAREVKHILSTTKHYRHRYLHLSQRFGVNRQVITGIAYRRTYKEV